MCNYRVIRRIFVWKRPIQKVVEVQLIVVVVRGLEALIVPVRRHAIHHAIVVQEAVLNLPDHGHDHVD